MKIIGPRLHGLLDYLTCILLLIVPYSLPLPAGPAYTSYAFAVLHFLITAGTKFQAGFMKIIPFRTHAMIELGEAIFFIFLAVYFYFTAAPEALCYFGGMSLLYITVILLTNYHSANPSGK